MDRIKTAGARAEVDEEGYLVNFEDWNEQVACALAEREGISTTCPLTEERMAILRFIRNKRWSLQAVPEAVPERPFLHRKQHLKALSLPDKRHLILQIHRWEMVHYILGAPEA